MCAMTRCRSFPYEVPSLRTVRLRSTADIFSFEDEHIKGDSTRLMQAQIRQEAVHPKDSALIL